MFKRAFDSWEKNNFRCQAETSQSRCDSVVDNPSRLSVTEDTPLSLHYSKDKEFVQIQPQAASAFLRFDLFVHLRWEFMKERF